MQIYDKIIAMRFLVRIAGRLNRRNVGMEVFDKRQSLEAFMRGTKSIFVDLNVRTVETAVKRCVPSFVRPSNFDAYILKCFTLV